MSGKGSISRMSDECLMKQETVFSFYTQYQAVMRKFTLAGKALIVGHRDLTHDRDCPCFDVIPEFIDL